MPGPGQGKQSQKKKWHKNMLNLNENKAAVNAVMTAPSTIIPNVRTATLMMLPSTVTTAAEFTDEATPKINSYTATLLATTMTTANTTANTATIDTSVATCVDTATATSSMNNTGSQQP
jgi:hypothetical protein